MEEIKNIIFDLGNVILNIDGEKTIQAMKDLGFDDFQESYTLLRQSDLFDFLEKGLIPPEKFHSELQAHFNQPVSPEKIDNAWNAMLLDFPKKRIRLIQSLQGRYRLFLLSNTNSIHYQKYNRDLLEQYGFGLSSLFEKAYYSFDLGMRKPDLEIFEYVIKDSRLKPIETLFIDDAEANIESAQQLGLKTLRIDVAKGEDIAQKLKGF
ncbi:MAG: HAD family phosphatase [Bacteroidales bacterium]|jgi:putative hydrolase of the HAD superfamily|nr:HAD family phosphatase [Bacteroidales bacterium]